MIDLVALQWALTVAEQGSFRRTASVLGVKTSVVSRRVRRLEDSIGVSLFQRQSKGVQPTLAGRRFLDQGRVILGDVEVLVRTAGRGGSGAEGRLCIGIVASLAGGTARDLIRAFKGAHPAVEIDIVEGTTGDCVSKVRLLQMDAVLALGSKPIVGLEVQPLWTEQIHVALPRDHPLTALDVVQWDHLPNARFIVSKINSGADVQDLLIRHLTDLGRRPAIEPRLVHRECLLALVGLGFGLSLVGDAATAVSYPNVAFRPLADQFLPFSAVWARDNDNPALRRFLSLARSRTKGLGAATSP